MTLELRAVIPLIGGIGNLTVAKGIVPELLRNLCTPSMTADSIRQLDDVVITVNHLRFKRGDEVLNGEEQSIPVESSAEQRRRRICACARVDKRPNKDAFRVQRQRCDIGIEAFPAFVHEEILLDVRYIEGSDRSVVLLQVLPDRADSRRPGKIPNDRYDEVIFLKLLNSLKILFGGQKASRLSVVVAVRHQFFVCR